MTESRRHARNYAFVVIPSRRRSCLVGSATIAEGQSGGTASHRMTAGSGGDAENYGTLQERFQSGYCQAVAKSVIEEDISIGLYLGVFSISI